MNEEPDKKFQKIDETPWTENPRIAQRAFWGIALLAATIIAIGLFALKSEEATGGNIVNDIVNRIGNKSRLAINRAMNTVEPVTKTGTSNALITAGMAQDTVISPSPPTPAPPPALPLRNSLSGLLEKPAFDETLQIRGIVEDVLVDGADGQARMIIVRSPERDQRVAFDYSAIMTRNDEGVVMSRSARPDAFEYARVFSAENEPVSLRILTGSDILDVDGNVIGTVTNVTFDEDMADQIFFSVADPNPEDENVSGLYYQIPFGNIRIRTDPGGYNVQLDEEQTAHIARTILPQ